MIEQKYSVTRTRATWKPRVADDDLPFFQCPDCGRVYQGIAGSLPGCLSNDPRNPLAEPPYARDLQNPPSCCGAAMKRMPLTELDGLPAGVELDYRILGGFNNNAVECSWRVTDDRFSVRWVALKTFTGSQMKYVLPKKRSPLLFALADEDAYVYCDKSPCQGCTFMCKRGFVFYVGIEDTTDEAHRAAAKDDRGNPVEGGAPLTSLIARLPLTRMSPYLESRS